MNQPLTLENAHLQVVLWPQFGGKISSIVDKADHFDLLFNYPSELPTTSLYDREYSTGWYGGWDECFPAVAPSVYIGHPYNATHVPDHGELWGLPANATPIENGVRVVWYGLRFGYRLTRTLRLQDMSLLGDYVLENLAPFEFRFVWSPLARLAMDGALHVALTPSKPFRLVRENNHSENFLWPTPTMSDDLSRPETLPGKRTWRAFSAQPIHEPASVVYEQRGRVLEVAYSSDDEMNAYWAVWINNGGWFGHRYMSVAPASGRYDAIDASIHDASCGKVGPSSQLTWRVGWTVRDVE